MVSTRNHPQDFPSQEPDESILQTPSKKARSTMTTSTSQDVLHRNNSQKSWSHTPSFLTLLWLGISLPLVTWDTFYVFLRPHSMPGGKYQKPLWVPYELYGQVDHVYGWPAYNSGNGFTAAQSGVNVVECVGYIYYLYLVYTHGKTEPTVQGTGAPDKQQIGKLAQSRTVHGSAAAKAVVLLYGVALMTLSKTVLYWLNEVFSGFANIGHNDPASIFFLWALPNGLWIAFPIYLVYVSAKEILEGLQVAIGDTKKSL
ncbi:hypothetical protein E4T42_02454 [Aureobasidium subglaciale]|uniref:EXPERA domain-containing protein n=1 Tax=Aureobasidium subglaciale (strain EXF-2481) TaxID=1043005 RepID=A0A074YEM4_AURSE|nr:uncharacterized protein AUEXF2481DRAFT_28950 [Aureobasidium subglaciale EXF-2481]KAI5202766.1 hypothetical protein E4T38_05444 [Aureobasidium subglaciale]KAI5225573.1 hypothetical protein E4T41_05196 [Aureobasidium subglaciale]KAI5254362.1 hypothetical protein E4T42_02454 [Aureobasidium subglaciale]KEQ96248.1 hypothetical protein AUEXF2481DRAFT_28950 [Aureobasidium subglaciale EXF-2481]